jgi:hypothetical protein
VGLYGKFSSVNPALRFHLSEMSGDTDRVRTNCSIASWRYELPCGAASGCMRAAKKVAEDNAGIRGRLFSHPWKNGYGNFPNVTGGHRPQTLKIRIMKMRPPSCQHKIVSCACDQKPTIRAQ